MPRAAADEEPHLCCLLHFGQVQEQPVSRHVMVAYDDRFSIEYFYQKLRPYWRRDGMGVADLLQAAHSDYDRLAERARQFDLELMDRPQPVGRRLLMQCCARWPTASAWRPTNWSPTPTASR